VTREQDAEPYELAATERCICRDLDLPADAVAEVPARQRERHALLEAFYARRAQSPVGQETIEGLQANIVAYSLHAGRWRGLTWHDEELAIVWLLAGIVLAFLALDFVFHASGANNVGFASFVFSVGTVLAAPFAGIFKTTYAAHGNLIIWADVLAMVIYALLAVVIVKVVAMVAARSSATTAV